jgi:prepilin peptidase CpaA
VNSNAWWPNLIVLLVASGIDLRTRRIPNWLSVPFLLSGVVVQSITGGWLGLRDSLEGFGLALLLFGPPCFLRVMGMGDLKLAAGVGAWIGPSQFIMAFIVTGMVGGVMAGFYAARDGRVGRIPGHDGRIGGWHGASETDPATGFGSTPRPPRRFLTRRRSRLGHCFPSLPDEWSGETRGADESRPS